MAWRCGPNDPRKPVFYRIGVLIVPTRSLRTPSYRLHKPTKQAVVTLDGRDFYLGRYDSPESRVEYDRLIAEWLFNGRRLSPVQSAGGSDSTINELLLAYLRYADGYYVKAGKPTKEAANIRLAVRPLRQLYGHTVAQEFGPLKLKAVRQAMIDAGICRSEINRRIGRLVRVFKWGVGEEIVPPNVHHSLQAVPGFRRGRVDVRESKPIKPVPESFVEAIRPHVARQVWAMVQLQRLTGMRPGEVVSMRTADIDTSGKVWAYTPESHKTEHHGRPRVIHLGPKAQAVLRPWLRVELTLPLFSPADAVAERKEMMRASRKTAVQPSQVDRSKSKPKRQAGKQYPVDSYRRAIAHACIVAGVPKWHPHQLRHSAATWLRKEFGIDVARVVLGHSSTAVTEIYAEMDLTKAAEAMERVG